MFMEKNIIKMNYFPNEKILDNQDLYLGTRRFRNVTNLASEIRVWIARRQRVLVP